ncbi:MAG: DUF4143 domain-containing protein [Saprospiraceae bacterium]|nr:DUF4143 domain-containing protein [Saprospiraceae bacterium]
MSLAKIIGNDYFLAFYSAKNCPKFTGWKGHGTIWRPPDLRKEISKSPKFYFYDNGIRNALISNFNSIDLRNDIGQLWENFLISERIKHQQYTKMIVNNFFWRTYDQQEIDWIEERNGKLFGYEIKWNKTHVKPPLAWRTAYPDASFETLHPDHFRSFAGIGDS